MLSGKYVSTCLLLLLCSAVFILNMSCSDTGETNHNNTPVSETPGVIYTTDNNPPITETPDVMYKTYEMKPDDKRLRYLDHPLFSLEYPDVFQLIDVNKIPDYPMVYDVSDVGFKVTQVYQYLPDVLLLIRIIKPGFYNYYDTSDVFDEWISTAESNGDIITSSKRSVLGIQSGYIETSGTRDDVGIIFYPSRNESFRSIVFNYKDLIWSINITWDYFESEPPEVDEYFDHIIETFKILE